MRTKVLSCLLATSLLVVQAFASNTAYVHIKGQKQGEIKGGNSQKGRENTLSCIAVDHDIASPRDARSGLPSGQRMHRPIKLTFTVDRAMPQLYTALTTNENLSDVTIDFWGTNMRAASGAGMETNTLTIKLTNASISDIHFNMPNSRDADTDKLPMTIEVSFTYQKIEWISKDGNVVASDDWRSN